MTLTRHKQLLALVGVMTLAGCEKTKEIFGMQRTQPDEFTVLSHPPLSAPPGIGLKPPLPEGASSPGAETRLQAQEALLGHGPSQGESSAASPGEKALLDQAGASDGPSTIRADLARDRADKEGTEKNLVQKALYWQKEADQKEPVIDAKEEYKKIHGTEHPGDPSLQHADSAPSSSPSSEASSSSPPEEDASQKTKM